MRNAIGRTLLVTMTFVATLATIGVSSAIAAPKGEYAGFANCPLNNPRLAACFVARIESGAITIGKQTVPIVSRLTLQGGYVEEQSGALQFVGALNGNTLSKAPQKIPGGLAGLLRCDEIGSELGRTACQSVFVYGQTGLTATTELAAPASSIGLNEENVFQKSGVGLSLPVKVKLENPLLGDACYVGSSSHPITLSLTDGTTSPPPPNRPMKGQLGKERSKGQGGILDLIDSSLVDNSFATPLATGCGGGYASLIDPLIDSKLGLPSAAGRNTATLGAIVEQASAEVAREYSE